MSDESLKTKPISRISGNDEPSTSNKNFKGTSVQSGKFLKNNHPELFKLSPRPGGFCRHLAARKDASRNVTDGGSSSNKPKNSSSTRENLRVGSHANISEILETSIQCPVARTRVSKVDKKNDTVRMCSTAISTVMMLALKTYEDITAEHIVHSEAYFRWLRQDDGYPRNVGQLVELLTKLKANGKIVTPVIEEKDDYVDVREEEEEEDEADDRVTMSDLLN